MNGESGVYTIMEESVCGGVSQNCLTWEGVGWFFLADGTSCLSKQTSHPGSTTFQNKISFDNSMGEPIEAIAEFLGWKVSSRPSQSGTIMYKTETGKISEVIRVGKGMIPWLPSCVKKKRLAEVIAYAESRPPRIAEKHLPEIERLYWEEGLSQPEVGERLGFTEHQVSHAMKKFGLSLRTKSEQIKRAYATGRKIPVGIAVSDKKILGDELKRK